MAVTGDTPETFPRILPCGDSALMVEFSDRIDAATNRHVVALAESLARAGIEGLLDIVPTYRSLLVQYDPARIRGRDLASRLNAALERPSPMEETGRRVTIPAVYGDEAGLDLDALADLAQMHRDDLIALHAQALYRVYMIGFAPGFAYLGGLPEPLFAPRLAAPRQRVEAGSIGIGGQQAGITSVPGPSGWRFIARTPVRLFDPDRAAPFLLRAGDQVRFRPVTATEAAVLDAAVARGASAEEWASA